MKEVNEFSIAWAPDAAVIQSLLRCKFILLYRYFLLSLQTHC